MIFHIFFYHGKIHTLLLFSCQVVSNSSVTAWSVAHQAPLSMGSSRHQYWSGLPFLSPGNLPDPGIWTRVSCIAGGFFIPEPPGKLQNIHTVISKAWVASFSNLTEDSQHFWRSSLEIFTNPKFANSSVAYNSPIKWIFSPLVGAATEIVSGHPLLPFSYRANCGHFQVLAFPNLTFYYFLFVCCCCSVIKLCLSLCNPVDCSTPGFPVLHHLLEFAQTQVHWVGDAIQPSHRLLSPSPFVFSLSQHLGLFQLVGSSYQVAKVLELQLQEQHIQNSLLESKTYPKFPWEFKLHSRSSKESPGNYKSCSRWFLIQPAEFTLMLQMAPCLSWVGCTGHCGCSFGCSS